MMFLHRLYSTGYNSHFSVTLHCDTSISDDGALSSLKNRNRYTLDHKMSNYMNTHESGC